MLHQVLLVASFVIVVTASDTTPNCHSFETFDTCYNTDGCGWCHGKFMPSCCIEGSGHDGETCICFVGMHNRGCNGTCAHVIIFSITFLSVILSFIFTFWLFSRLNVYWKRRVQIVEIDQPVQLSPSPPAGRGGRPQGKQVKYAPLPQEDLPVLTPVA